MKLRIPYFVATLMATASIFYVATTPGLSAAQLVSFNTVSGHKIDLAAPQGKSRLVSFWAPDCPISERDQADLSQLQQQFGDEQFEIVAVAMPYAKTEDVQSKLTDIDYPVALDSDGIIANGFPGVRFTPTTFLIDGEGKIVWRHVGRLNATNAARHITEVMQPDQMAENTLQTLAGS